MSDSARKSDLKRAALASNHAEDPLMEEAKKIAAQQQDMGGRNVYVSGYGWVRVPLKRAR